MPRALDAFRKFRATLDDAAHGAGIDLRLVSDQRKAPPRDRFCWFEGADVTGDEVAELSRREATRLRADKPVRPFATELHPVVYVETARNAAEALQRRERDFVDGPGRPHSPPMR